ncbi:hypothetical protein INR49_000138 [Caranx melampygus]|nr:hypothetical protein INR49_000138 [Caranx melampygus]
MSTGTPLCLPPPRSSPPSPWILHLHTMASLELQLYFLLKLLAFSPLYFTSPRAPSPSSALWRVVFKVSATSVGAHRLSRGASNSRCWSAQRHYLLFSLFISNSCPLPHITRQTRSPGDKGCCDGGKV